jgi:hypothetical protein
LAKTNREQSLIVHALFGKRNLRNLAAEDKEPRPSRDGNGLGGRRSAGSLAFR